MLEFLIYWRIRFREWRYLRSARAYDRRHAVEMRAVRDFYGED
jgi:hypothetical protein